MTDIFENNLKAFLVPIGSVQQMRDWHLTFFGLDFPSNHIDPESNSSPAEWMFEAYTNYRENRGNVVPGYVVLSSRESYKTLTEAAFAVLMMAHFGCTIAHMAAIENQAAKAVEYITSFVAKIKPYLEASKISVDSANKRQIGFTMPDGSNSYVQVIIATMTGANSPHTNLFMVDEVDVMRFPQAYEEAKLIPGVFNGQFPLTVKTSTRKFAFGMMEKEIQNAPNAGEKVLRWNLLDVTEYCPPERHKPDEPKEIRYIHNDLPLRNLSESEWRAQLPDKQKEFERIEAFAGCATCSLLPVCKTRLALRSPEDSGGLFKPIDFTIGQFKKVSPDMGEAQLLCRKPSLSGLIYKRFDETEVVGNTLTLAQAYQQFTQMEAPIDVTINDLAEKLVDSGMMFKAAIDWGFRHYFVILVGCKLPNGDVWILDCYAVQELELEDKLKYGYQVNNLYMRVRFYPDSEDPASIKTFRRKGLKCVDFKKDISAGIEAVRRLIIDGHGRRRLKVVKHERTEMVIQMFRVHHFKLDPAGKPTKEPDDEEFADIGDATRYFGQNIVSKTEVSVGSGGPGLPLNTPGIQKGMPSGYHEQMAEKIRELAGQSTASKGKSSTGGFIWDFGSDVDPEDNEP